jgi:hypothetical protein
VHGKLVKSTERAMCITIWDVEGKPLEDPKNEWFPKSQIVDYTLSDDLTEPDCFSCKKWIMEGKGLI